MSLVANINRRKKLGISRSKKKSTISPEAYKAMQNNWKKSNKKKSQELIMPSGKGTYGSKRGRPSKKSKMKQQSAIAIAKKKKLKIIQWLRRRLIFFRKNYLKLEVSLKRQALVDDLVRL